MYSTEFIIYRNRMYTQVGQTKMKHMSNIHTDVLNHSRQKVIHKILYDQERIEY